MDLKETELLYKYKTKGPAEAGTLLVFTGKSLMQLVRSIMVLASLINPISLLFSWRLSIDA